MSRLRLLRAVLAAAGVFLIVGLYPAAHLWPAGFGWTPPHPAFERMMTALYATLGVFLLLAARAPVRYRPIIDFTIASSITHGGVMAYDAWRDAANRLHLVTDIPALLALAVALLVLRPAAAEVTHEELTAARCESGRATRRLLRPEQDAGEHA